MKRNSQKYVIRAVHDCDLESLLRGLDLLEPLRNGELRCSICGCQISQENLLCVYPYKSQVKVCCTKMECYKEALRRSETT